MLRGENSVGRISKLRHDLLIAGNRPLNNFWKISNIQQIPAKAIVFHLSPKAVNQIGDLAEGIKGEANRKTDCKEAAHHGPCMLRCSQLRRDIFKPGEQCQIQKNPCRKKSLFALNHSPEAIIEGNAHRKHREVPWAEAPVKPQAHPDQEPLGKDHALPV